MKTHTKTIGKLIGMAVAMGVVLQGCGSPKSEQAPKAPTTPVVGAHEEEHHHHEASRGGALVELGEEVGHFEFVLEKESGKLSAYASDAHAEEPVRLKGTTLQLQVAVNGGAPVAVSLEAVANALTGETVGDSSEFTRVVELLKGVDKFDGILPAMEFRGVQVPEAKFSYPKGNE